MEDEERKNEDDLVEELTPPLHQESHCDVSSTVETVGLGRDATRSSSILHGCSSSHGIFSTDTDTVHEERPSVANNPSIETRSP